MDVLRFRKVKTARVEIKIWLGLGGAVSLTVAAPFGGFSGCPLRDRPGMGIDSGRTVSSSTALGPSWLGARRSERRRQTRGLQ